MIATVQFDLSNAEDLAKFQSLLGTPAPATEAPAVDEAKPAKPRKSKAKDEPKPEPEVEAEDPALEFPPKEGTPDPVMPSIDDIAKLFSECQAKDAKAAGAAMKAFLTSQNAKSVRELDDMQRFDLKKELEALAFNPFG